jgi:predicted nucleic acid-binding protein
VIYVDSSAIVKRYYDEPGSERLRARWSAAERVFTSRVAHAEVHEGVHDRSDGLRSGVVGL